MGDNIQAVDTSLVGNCMAAKELAFEFIKWSVNHPDVVGQDHLAIRRQFNRYALQMDRLARAASRPMAVAVFGPSQAGKSYLISALARKGTNPVVAKFGDQRIDFLQKINPAGGKESTGIVTRFTIRSTPSPYPDNPVVTRLLDESDVIKILANSFFSDIDPSRIPDLAADEISAVLEQARAAAASSAVDGFTEAMVYDLRDYLMRGFRGISRLRSLTDDFWDECAQLIPRLAITDRARLMSILWAGTDEFTRLYIRLYQGLQRLGFSDEAYAALETTSDTARGALLPRVESIIDVAALQGLRDGSTELLTVIGSSGRSAELPRSDYAALIAELVIEMEEKPYDYFDYTDLLDFPGYRSRVQIRDIDDFLDQSNGLESLFLRGKVAYLFQRYREDRELTSMMLCIADSNQEVKSLPEVVDEWITDTHGETPEQRTGRAVSLFLVLTKFDKEFDEKQGVGENDEDFRNQWENRIHSSLWDFLGQQHEWPKSWDSYGAFRNTFWIRNPTYKAKHLFEYNDNGDEICLVSSKRERDRIDRLKRAFLDNGKVTCHFENPDKAWESALTPNDGGVTYLAESLGRICRPELKRDQILSLFRSQLAEINSVISEYYISDDKTQMLSKRMENARQVASALIRCSDTQRFGPLLKLFQISEATLIRLYYKLDHNTPTSGAVVVNDERRVDTDLHDLLGLVRATPDEHVDDSQPMITSFSELYADEVMGNWISALYDVAGDPNVHRYFFLPNGTILELIKELKAGSVRLKIRQRIVDAVNEATRLRLDIHHTVAYPARRTAQILNDFINYLGFDTIPLRERPKIKDKAIFEALPEVSGLPKLDEYTRSYELEYTGSWLRAFLQLVELNANNDFDNVIDIDANNALAKIKTRVEGLIL